MKVLFLVMAIVFCSCSSQRPGGKTEAEVLYKEALALVEDGKYILATEKLNTLKSEHPYSYYASPAELLLADILFAQENYAEASAAYILFRDFHPKHERIEYVIWRIGESFFNQLPPTYDRDLSSGLDAVRYYQEILNRFPKSEYTKAAKERIHYCNEMRRAKERYIADFYYKTDVYDAARYRYIAIVNETKDQELRGHAIMRILETSYLLGEYKQCLSYYQKYRGLVKNYYVDEINRYQDLCKS